MVLELLTGGSLRGLLDAGARLTPVAGGARRPPGHERARVRARAWRGAPRHQAREPPLRRARHRAGRRLRSGARAGGGELDGTGGHGGRHGAVRRAGAGDRRAARRARRPLLTRDRARGGGHGHGAERRRDRDRHARGAHAHPLVAPLALGRLGRGRRTGRPSRIRPTAIPTRRRCAPRSPTPRARSRRRNPCLSPACSARSTAVRPRSSVARPRCSTRTHPSRAAGRCSTTSRRSRKPKRRRAPGAVQRVSVAVAVVVVLALRRRRDRARGRRQREHGGGPDAGRAVDSGRDRRRWPTPGSRSGSSGATPTIPKGTVIAQRPAPGAFVGDGGDVELVVSRGPPPVAVADMQGRSPDDAQAALEGAGVRRQRRSTSTTRRCRPARSWAPIRRRGRRSRVTRVKVHRERRSRAGDGARTCSGKTFDEASQVLTNAGFTVTRATCSSDVDKDKVIGTDPPAGSAAKGLGGDDRGEQGPRAGDGAPREGPVPRSSASSSCKLPGLDVDTPGLPARSDGPRTRTRPQGAWSPRARRSR